MPGAVPYALCRTTALCSALVPIPGRPLLLGPAAPAALPLILLHSRHARLCRFTSMLPDGGDGAGPPPPPVGFFPAMPSGGGRPDAPRSGRRPVSPRAEAAAGTAQELPQPSALGAEPMDMGQSETSQQTERGAGASSAPSQQQQQQQAGASAMQMEGGAPAPLVNSVTLEQMQQQFARAMRQEITFGELESFLKQHNLLPSGQPAPGGPSPPMQQQQQAGGAAAANGPAPKLQAGSGGLEDMQVIQQALPSASGS